MGGVFALISNKEPSLKEQQLQKEVISVSSYSNRLSNAFSANDFLPNGRKSKKTNNIFYLSNTNEYENKLYSLDNSMGYMKISNQKFSWLLFFALLLPLGLLAQSEQTTNNKEAEELFASTFPLGVSLGIQTMSYNKSGFSGPFEHDLDPLWMPEFGFKYNFLQKNRFNFSVGLHARYVRHEDFIYSYSHETDVYNISKNSQDNITYHIPLTAEYIFHTSGSTSFVAHAGYELQYSRYSHFWPYDKTVEDPNSDGKVRLYGDYFTKEISHGLNLGFGVYQKLGSRLMKFELNYHYHFSQLMENRIIATDLPNQPDVDRSINWNGNNIAAKVTFYPFKRSKK